MRYLWNLLLFIPFLGFAQGETPAQANKKLFDRTIDELNFRTFETVYDKHFTRQKFPENLRTAAARREFTNFENNAELQKLFLNYNGVAERYKTRFGGGSLSQAEFEKQLNAVVRDRNFEFFIRGLPRDERSALIRTEQRIIKQAVARFNASAETSTANVPAADVEPEPTVASAPLTTNGPAPEATPTATASEPELRSPDAEADAPGTGPGWVGYLTLLSSLATLGLGGFALLSVLPELRRLRRRVRELEDLGNQASSYAEADSDTPDQAPAEARPSFLSRLRGPASGELLADHYDDEDDDPDPRHPAH
jgi:hypothetical protein